MKILTKVLLTICALSPLVNLQAQKRPSVDDDVFNQFASLGAMYKKVPLQLAIHIQNAATPVTTAADTIQTSMDLYLGYHFYYMQTEGIEEIINDSLLIMVNNKIKEMQLFHSNPELLARAANLPAMFMQDSSRIVLGNKFDGHVETLTGGNKKINLISKAKVTGTNFSRESISIEYHSGNFQIIECTQTREHLIPVDASLYNTLQTDTLLTGRLLHRTGSDGDMYFLVKQNSITYRFTKIDYSNTQPPVNTVDRIAIGQSEKYKPAKGFEQYSISQQF